MDVHEIIRSAQQEARSQGSTQVNLTHITHEQVDELAGWTMQFLRTRPAVDSELVPGWRKVRAMDAGVLRAWVDPLDLSDAERKRVRPLRMQVYDLLEEQGLIYKPPGQGSSIHVSPDDALATHNFPKPKPKPKPLPPPKPKPTTDLRAAVEAALRSRVEELCHLIAKETSLDPSDYWAVTTSAKPLDVLVRLIWSNSERGTFKRLHDVGRLDLTLDAALLEWTDLPLQQDLIDEATARVDWWS